MFLPTAVAEVLVGIVLGKSGFDLVQTEGILSFLSNYGVIFLLFLEWDGDRLFYFQEKITDHLPHWHAKAAKAPSTSPVQVAAVAYGEAY